MTTEEILTRVNAARAALARDEAPGVELDRLAHDLAAQIRREAAASQGCMKAEKVISSLLKAVKKDRPGYIALHYAWIDAAGRQCVCDGYRAFRLVEPLPLEARPDCAGEPVKLETCMPSSSKGLKAVPLPAAHEVFSAIALQRAAYTGKRGGFCPEWDFGEGLPVVNAHYLLDLLTVLPDAVEAFVKPREAAVSGLYVTTAKGEGMIMPLKTEAKVKQYTAARVRFQMLDALLKDYAEKAAEDPDYSITPAQFAYMANFAA